MEIGVLINVYLDFIMTKLKTSFMRRMIVSILLLVNYSLMAQVSKGWYGEAQLVGGHCWYHNESFNRKFFPYYKGGVNIVRMWNGKLGLGVGLGFSGEGVANKYQKPVQVVKERAFYTKLPIFARFLFTKTKTAPFADAGIFFGFFAGGNTKSTSGGHTFVDKTNVAAETELGFFGNLGVNHNLGSRNSISALAGFNKGISPARHQMDGKSPIVTSRNIGVGIGFSRKF